LQEFAPDRRRALFLDAAWLETAREAGLTAVSGNISGMDLLLQARGEVSVLLYGTDRETAPD
jgi:hypothetical protein